MEAPFFTLPRENIQNACGNGQERALADIAAHRHQRPFVLAVGFQNARAGSRHVGKPQQAGGSHDQRGPPEEGLHTR